MSVQWRRLPSLALLALLLSPSSGALRVWESVPDFAVRPLEGPAFEFIEAARTHAAVVVVFLSVVCPYSNSHEEVLRDLDARYGSQGLLLVGINSNRTETVEEVAAHARLRGQAFPIMKDAGNKVADLFGARVTP